MFQSFNGETHCVIAQIHEKCRLFIYLLPEIEELYINNVQYFVLLKFTEEVMAFTASDVVPLSQARATLSELADQVKAGAEKIITKNGESYVAIIDAARLDYYHQLEREQIHLLILDDARKGLDDVAAGKVKNASMAINALKRKRRANAALSKAAR